MKVRAFLSCLALPLILSACGGDGSSGVSSTPPPPTYTKLSSLAGDQDFQSSGVHFSYANNQTSGQSTQAFGRGVAIKYTAATDTYTLLAPDGTSTVFASGSNSAPSAGATSPSGAVSRSAGSDTFSLTPAAVNGVTLSYTATADWNHIVNGVQSQYFAVTGVPTVASDMPRSGTATYQTSVTGMASTCACVPTTLQQGSTASFSADFGAGTVTTTLNLVGSGINRPPVSYGSFTGSGTITAGSPGFSGTLASAPGNSTAATGAFSGAFFGPQATEMGYGWFVTSGLNGFNAQGVVTGTR